MKNKKLVLTVLSTAVVSSMTASAFAAPQEGIYVGGDVGKYYSLEAFVSAKNFDGALAQINEAGPEQVLYVSADGLAATLDIIADAEDFESVLEEVTEETLEYISGLDGFDVVKVDGTIEDEPYFPEEDIDMPEVAKIELKLPAGKDAEITVGSATDGELTLVATALDKDGEEVLDAEIMFMSDKPAVAMVDAMSGKVKAVAEGMATITAKSGDKSATFVVTVKKAVDPVPTEIAVASVSATNATTVKIVLDKAPEAEYTNADASKFKVLASGEVVAVSSVAKVASDLTGKTYNLTIASLSGKQGSLSVNSKEAVVVTGKEYAFDYKAPETTGIVAKGKKTLEVSFSEKLDASTVVLANFEVNPVVAATGTYTVNTAIIDATGKKVVLTVDTDLTVADYVVVLGKTTTTTADVKDVAGNSIYNGTQVTFRPTPAQLADLTAPAFTKATYNKVTGALTLTFNKNVLDSTVDVTKLKIGDYALTSGDSVSTGAANDNVISITLSATSKTAVNAMTGSLTVTASADAFGDVDSKTTGESIAVATEEPAVVSSASYNQATNILTVMFDKPVTLEASTVLSLDDTDQASSVTVTKAMATEDVAVARATWTFDLTGVAASAEALTPANLKLYILPDAVKNEAGVTNAATQSTYATGVQVTYGADTTKPSLQSVTYNNFTEKLVLTFSENINPATATEANIKLWQASGDDLDGFTSLTGLVPTETASTKTLTYDLSGGGNGVLDLAVRTGKAVKVTLDANTVRDEASLTNDATTYATGSALVYFDYEAPTVTGWVVAVNKNLLKVTFAEPVDKASAENVANYTITDSTGATLAVTSAIVQPTGTMGTVDVYVTTADQVAGKPYTLTISNVKDTAGNTIVPADKNFTGIATAALDKLTVDNVMVEAPVNAKNDTITVEFNTGVNVAQATNVANYAVLEADTNDAAGWANARSVSLTNAKVAIVTAQPDQVKITLDSYNLQNGKFYKVVASNITTINGKALGTATGDMDHVSVVTAFTAPVAPMMTQSNTATGAIKLVFAEELVKAEAEKAENYTVLGKTVTKATYTWDETTSKATVVLDLNTALTVPTAVGLAQTTGVTKIKNLAGVGFASATIAAPATIGDLVAPTVKDVVANAMANVENDTITINFNDNDVLQASATHPANYVVKDAQGNVVPATSYAFTFNNDAPGNGSNDQVVLTFSGLVSEGKNYDLQNGQTYTVELKDVMDISGNKIATTAKVATWNVSTDKTAPTLAGSATVTGSTLAVMFSEDVVASTATLASNYTIVYDADGNFATATDQTAINPIFVAYSGSTTDTATITVSNIVAAPAAGSKYKVTAKNVKDLAGNVQMDGSFVESTFAPIGVTGTLGSITQGVAALTAATATGTITYGSPSDGSTVTVGGSGPFTKITPVVNPTSEFSTIGELTTLINGLGIVAATDNGTTTITVTAATPGVAGNSIALAASGMTVSSATLTGGVNAVTGVTETVDYTVTAGASASGNITVTVGGTAHTVAVTAGQTATQVATAIAAQLTTDGVTGYTVTNPSSGVVRFTSTASNSNVTDLTVVIS